MNLLLVLAVLATVSPRVLYIASRADGAAGTGTITDPFDGSTAGKLWQAWLQAAYRKDGVSNNIIVFLPGAYSCTNELRLPSDARYVQLIGTGAVITYAEQGLTGQRTILSTSWDGNDNVTIQGFTLDCGVATTNGKVCGVFSRGLNNAVRDVTIRNIIGQGQETFGIILYADGGRCSGNTVVGASGDQATGISVSGDGCAVADNVVDLGDHNPDNSLTSFGFSIYGSRMTFTGNVARGCDAGLSMDGSGSGGSSAWADNLIVGNQLAGNEMAVRINNNSQSYTNWTWVGNNFQARGRSWLSMWTSEPWQASTKISGHTFIGNLFTGPARKAANLTLSNYREPYVFIGNRFSEIPSVNTGTNKNTLQAEWNFVRGKADTKSLQKKLP